MKIICDTNVWYNIASNSFSPSENIILTPTLLSLNEIATTDLSAGNPHLIQQVINSINKYGKEIIPVNPFDFIITKHDSSYQGDASLLNTILKEFTTVLSIDMGSNFKLSEEVKEKIKIASKEQREATKNFASFVNEHIISIQKSIIQASSTQKHLKKNTLPIIKEMVQNLLNDYLKSKSFSIDYNTFDWKEIELFLYTTENFFKHLETTKGMKFDPNDTVDWLNTLYVRPGSKYLTFERSWCRYIKNDVRTKNYLYIP